MKKQWIDLGACLYVNSMMSVFAVDSEVVKGLTYAIEGNTFKILYKHDLWSCELHEAEKLIQSCVMPELAEEMREILDDMVEHKRGELNYGKRLQVFHGETEGRESVHLQRAIMQDIEQALLQGW